MGSSRKGWDVLGLFKEGGAFGPAAIDPMDALTKWQMYQQSNQLFKETTPTRQGFNKQFEDLFSGQFNPEESPMYAPVFAAGKKGIEGQYDVARENVLANLPRGGTMNQGLTDIETSRAEQASSLPSMISQSIVEDLMNKAYGSVFPVSGSGAGVGMSGLSGLMQMINQNSIAAQQAQAQKSSSLMSSLGGILGMFSGGGGGGGQ